ncbi:MAG: D-alanyl-D-alanine carboxypeptidase/D-alanyl-D-alanine-endopeptidase [Myxococcota bacterium]
MPVGALLLCALAATPPGGDRELVAHLQSILQAPELHGAQVGVHVRSLDDGRVLFDLEGQTLFNPASNTKLLTTAAALEVLGPSYRFGTEVHRSPAMKDGVVDRLYVTGGGDPTLTTEAMFGLVNEIALRGIEGIGGDLVIDDSFFDDVREGPGWEEETGDPAYAAPVGAFSVNFNTFVLRVTPAEEVGRPARVRVWPDVGLVDVVVDAVTRGRRTRSRLWAGTKSGRDGKMEVVLRGAIALDAHEGFEIRRRVHDPSRFAGEMMKSLLQMRGIEVKGRVRRGLRPSDAIRVTGHGSPPLATILSKLNKYSNNFMAEQILKTMGAEESKAPGSWASGIAVVERFLKDMGVPEDQYVLGNGSGLNDVNRVTPALVTELLARMHQRFDVRPEFVASLATAGLSGTIHRRFEDTPAETRLRAKTGSLTGVSALSGYVLTHSDELLAFSIMMNGYRGRARPMWNIQDQIGVALAAHDTLIVQRETPSSALAGASRAPTGVRTNP